MNEEVIKIEDIIYALKKRWKMIVGITLTFTLIAGLVTFFVIKPKYETKVRVFIGKEGATPDTGVDYSSGDLSFYQDLVGTYIEILKNNDSIKMALKDIKQEDTQGNINRVLAGLSVSQSGTTQIMDIKYTTTDMSEIIPVIESVTDQFIVKSKQLIKNGNVEILENAKIPSGPISPNKPLNVIIGFMLGLMVAIGLAFLLEYLDNTVKTTEELENLLGMPVLADIPRVDEI